MRIYAIGILLVSGWLATAQADVGQCKALVPWGIPAIQNPTLLNSVISICRDKYTLAFNPVTRTPVWVAEFVTREMISGNEPRAAKFFDDPALPATARSHMKDYSRSGYDMGHMAPAGDFVGDAQQTHDSFYLSNIVPQVGKDFNRGIWMHLESWVRKCVRTRGPLLVVTGPIYANGQPKEWLHDRVAVPTHLFKVVTDPRSMESVAFVMTNEAHPHQRYTEYAVSVRKVEGYTGLNFHSALVQPQADVLETQTKIWNCR